MSVTFNLNGVDRKLEVDSSTPLLYVLRDDFGLNGAKYGCGLGQCGACTVQLDGRAIFSCLTPLAALVGRHVKTVEGLGTIERPSVLQQAFEAEQAAQCGYCIAGMIMRADVLLNRHAKPSDEAIRTQMQTNLCRCGTHMRILRAVRRASDMMSRLTANQEFSK